MFNSLNDLQGSGATEDCCSKCFLENQKKRGCQPVQQKQSSAPTDVAAVVTAVEDAVQPMEVESTLNESAPEEQQQEAAILKKKKKKTSYKAMIAAMTTTTAPRDVEKEKEAIRQATGGGAFSKVDKI
jgi:hypothetical protein